MKLEGAEFPATEATEELIHRMMYDDVSRGEYMILDSGEDQFVQIAGENESFVLEYHDKTGHYTCASRVITRQEAENAMLDELNGRTDWRKAYDWRRTGEGGASKMKMRLPIPISVKTLLLVVLGVFALAYIIRTANLCWKYGLPDGLCTRCGLFWGKHESEHRVGRERGLFIWSFERTSVRPPNGGIRFR